MNPALQYTLANIYNFRYRGVVSLTKEYSVRQWWSTDELYKLGDQGARSLAIHSAKNVPYYRQIFKDVGIDPEKMNFPDDWNRLPVLEKDTLRARYQDLISETDHSKKARQNHSGGSTGKPVTFLSDLALYEMMAANMRLIFSWAGWKPGEMVLHLWGGKEKKLPLTLQDRFKAWLSGALILPVYSFDVKIFFEWWKVLKSYKPTIIYAYPSVVAEFSRWLKEKGYEPIGIKGVFCSAEVLLPEHRKVIEETFRCKAYNQYGSRETPCVACECPEGNMHLFIDLNRVEFLDQAQDPDGPKQIIVTPLHNYAQPLIRYALGDLGTLKDGICPCNRGYPLMEMPLGRQNDHIKTENGKLIYPSFFIHLLDGQRWIKKYQFRQCNLKSLDLMLETDPLPDIQERIIHLKSEMMPKLMAKMGQKIELNINAVPFIERTPAGKHRFVINELES